MKGTESSIFQQPISRVQFLMRQAAYSGKEAKNIMTKKKRKKEKNEFTLRKCMIMRERLNKLYFNELKKPQDEQDADLMEELLQTYEFYDAVVCKLSENKHTVFKFKLRRAVAYASVFLAFILVSSGIAEAAGFRIWSALLHLDDDNYLHVNYVPDDGNQQGAYKDPPPYPSGFDWQGDKTLYAAGDDSDESPEFIDFNSLNEAYEYAGIDLGLPIEIGGLDILKISVCKTLDVVHWDLEYLGNTGSLSVSVFIASADSVTSQLMPTDDGDYEITTISGVECIITQSDGNHHAKFTYNEGMYSLKTDIGYEFLCESIELICGK